MFVVKYHPMGKYVAGFGYDGGIRCTKDLDQAFTIETFEDLQEFFWQRFGEPSHVKRDGFTGVKVSSSSCSLVRVEMETETRKVEGKTIVD